MFFQVVNMADEMFNDGLFYTELATANENNDYLKWRYCRSAIVSFCTSAEAELNKLIVTSLTKKNNRTKEEDDMLNYLSNPNSTISYTPAKLKNLYKKYDLLLNLNGKSKRSFSTAYSDLTKLRNSIIHYSFSRKDKVYSQSIMSNILQAHKIVKDFIEDLYSIIDLPAPIWSTFTESREI